MQEKSFKVIHLSRADISGGAARAAYRIHQCLRADGVDSHMWVDKAIAGDWTVHGPKTRAEKAGALLRASATAPIVSMLKTSNPIMHSLALLPSNWATRINESDADLVNLHWVQHEMISIADIGRIKKPIVWTLHDMWAFCGAEHLAWDERWRDGYRRDNRPAHELGFDLNRWTWQRKLKHWLRPMQLVAPSQWLADCAQESKLMADWPVSVVANPIDTERWRPFNPTLARDLLGLPLNRPLLLFGSYGANQAHHKGFDLLLKALDYLQRHLHVSNLELVVLGQLAPQNSPKLGFPIHFIGHMHDDLSLIAIYSAVDAVVVPSRQEAFGQIAAEAHACATPVIAFRTGGLPDIVEHRHTGYLARPFDTRDLAEGIRWVLTTLKTYNLGEQARRRAETRLKGSRIAKLYRQVYHRVLAE